MAYAEAADLAAALRIRLPDDTALLDACLEAAAEEIDGYLDRGTAAMPSPVPSAVTRCNVNRAVEWYKATDAYTGTVGSDQAGEYPVQPGDGFLRHTWAIRRWKIGWGLA